MPEGTWLLFDRKELGENQYGKYLLVHGMDKSKHFIGDSKLWEYFETAEQWQPFLLTIEGKKIIGVQDVKNEILKTATVKAIRKLIESEDGERIRSQAVSYSKDIACSIISTSKEPFDYDFVISEMIGTAKDIATFIKEGAIDTGDKDITG